MKELGFEYQIRSPGENKVDVDLEYVGEVRMLLTGNLRLGDGLGFSYEGGVFWELRGEREREVLANLALGRGRGMRSLWGRFMLAAVFDF